MAHTVLPAPAEAGADAEADELAAGFDALADDGALALGFGDAGAVVVVVTVGAGAVVVVVAAPWQAARSRIATARAAVIFLWSSPFLGGSVSTLTSVASLRDRPGPI